MPFVAGPGGNSLASLAYADGYFADRGLAGWTGDDGAKQGALVRATDYVFGVFGPYLDPAKMAAAAASDPADYPDALKRAGCLYALVEIATPGGLAPAPVVDASGYGVVLTQRKVGPIQRNYAVVGDTTRGPTRRRFPLADALVAQVLTPPSCAVIR